MTKEFLLKEVEKISNIFRNEFLIRDKKPFADQLAFRVQLLVELGEAKVDEKSGEVTVVPDFTGGDKKEREKFSCI